MSTELTSDFSPTFPLPSPATQSHLSASKSTSRPLAGSQQLAPELQDSLLNLEDAISDNVRGGFSFTANVSADRTALVQPDSVAGIFGRDASHFQEMQR